MLINLVKVVLAGDCLQDIKSCNYSPELSECYVFSNVPLSIVRMQLRNSWIISRKVDSFGLRKRHSFSEFGRSFSGFNHFRPRILFRTLYIRICSSLQKCCRTRKSKKFEKIAKRMDLPGIDPGTSSMLRKHATICTIGPIVENVKRSQVPHAFGDVCTCVLALHSLMYKCNLVFCLILSATQV